MDFTQEQIDLAMNEVGAFLERKVVELADGSRSGSGIAADTQRLALLVAKRILEAERCGEAIY